jgi:hypothetical protein
LLRSEDGFVIAIVAVLVYSAFVVLGGLAVEAGLWYAVKRQNQSAADAAALAAAFEYAGGIETGLQTGPTNAPGAAISAASSNGFSAAQPPTMTPSGPSSPCPVQGTVEVVLNDQMNTLLGAASLGSTVTIATAATTCYQPLTVIRNGIPVSVSQSCLIALGQLFIFGQNGVPTFSMPNCIILDELSTSGNSIVINGVSGSWNLAALVTAGGIFTDGSPLPLKTFTQFPLAPMLAPTNSYPYWNVTASPPSSQCIPDPNINSANQQPPSPGILYCGLSFSAGANVVLAPGLYYIDGGNFQIGFDSSGTPSSLTAGASITSAPGGVTIVLTKVNQTNAGGINIAPGICTANISLTAPGPGAGLLGPSATASQGLLIFQDPTAVNNLAPPISTITTGAATQGCGTATVTLTGAIVTPATSPTVAGYPVAGAVAGCTELIAMSFTFTGNPQLDDFGCNSPSPAGGGIGRLSGSGSTGVTINQTNPVEQVFLSQ